MTFAQIDDRFDDHPKYVGYDAATMGVIACAITYANRNLTDGVIPAVWPRRRFGRQGAEIAKKLVEDGVWARRPDDVSMTSSRRPDDVSMTSGGRPDDVAMTDRRRSEDVYVIVGFLEHNTSKAVRLERVKKKHESKQEAGRKGGLAKAQQEPSKGLAKLDPPASASPLLSSPLHASPTPIRQEIPSGGGSVPLPAPVPALALELALTPSPAPRRPRPAPAVGASKPEGSDAALWRVFRAAWEKNYGGKYCSSRDDGAIAKRVAQEADAIVAAHVAETGADPGLAREQLLRNWVDEYLATDGAKGWLSDNKHPLHAIDREITSIGTPPAWALRTEAASDTRIRSTSAMPIAGTTLTDTQRAELRASAARMDGTAGRYDPAVGEE